MRTLAARYLDARLGSGELVETSVEVIRVVLDQWLRFVEYRHASTWTLEEVTGWVHDQAVRPSTRKSRLTKLRPFARWLVMNGVIDADPTLGVSGVKLPRGGPRDFHEDDVRRLLAACPDDRAVLIVLLMVQMGLRCGDTARVRLEDIDAHRQTLGVRGKGGRGELTHWVPIPDEVWSPLGSHIDRLGRSAGPLIESQRKPGAGITPHHMSHIVGEWVRSAGLKRFPYDGISPHSLRHTCAQSMLDNGADLRDVQFTLGHRTIRSTEGYLRREPPGLRAAINGRSYLAA